MDLLKSLDKDLLAKAAALAVISIPLALVYICYKKSQAPVEQPQTLEEAYPDEHLGI